MLERGELRFIRVSDLTPEQLEHVQQQHIQKRMNPVINGSHDAVELPPVDGSSFTAASSSRAHQSERSRAQRKRIRLITTLRPPGSASELRQDGDSDGVAGAESLVGVGVGDGDSMMPSDSNSELDAAQQIQYSDFVAQLAYLPPGGQQHPPTSNSRDGAEPLDQPSLHALLAASTAMLPEGEPEEHGIDGGQKRQREDDE